MANTVNFPPHCLDDMTPDPASSSPKPPTTVSREELYSQVWEMPMSRLAQTYGISGNGLAKVCNRLRIPYPPRGYWAKKAAGRKVVQSRLPERKEGTPISAVITPTPPPAPRPEVPPEIQRQVDAAKDGAGSIAVPDRLVRPHPAIAAWLTEREQDRARARRERDPWMRDLAPRDWTESERRRHRILDALFKAAERQGIHVKGRVPGRGVGAVGKSPALATSASLA